MKHNRELLKGSIRLLILRLLRSRTMYGYELIQEVQRLSGQAFEFNEGTLYPALHQLERKGFLRSEWRIAETGRKRKYYSLTSKGRRQAEHEQEGWKHFTGAINLILTSAQQ